MTSSSRFPAAWQEDLNLGREGKTASETFFGIFKNENPWDQLLMWFAPSRLVSNCREHFSDSDHETTSKKIATIAAHVFCRISRYSDEPGFSDDAK